MNIKVVNEQGEEIAAESNVPEGTPSDVIADSVILPQQVATLFDMRPNEISSNKHMLNTLIDYAKLKTDDHSPEGLKWAIRQLNMKVGTAPMGEKNINYLYRYAKLYLEGRSVEAEKEKYLRGERDD